MISYNSIIIILSKNVGATAISLSFDSYASVITNIMLVYTHLNINNYVQTQPGGDWLCN